MQDPVRPHLVLRDDQGISHPQDRRAMQPGAEPYYLGHFTFVLRMVVDRYGFLLSEPERQHVDRIQALSPAAQMLYARLVNRLGPYFRVDKLNYPELPSLEDAVTELQDAGLLSPGAPHMGTDAAPLLRCFTLPELTASLRPHGIAPPRRRADLLTWLKGWDGAAAWQTALLGRFRVVRIPSIDPWPFLRFLFFGELRDNLSDLVVRELGFLTPEDIAPTQLATRFTSRAAATDAFRMAGLYAEFRVIREDRSARDTLAWWQGQAIDRARLAAGETWFDRLVDRLGRRLEREHEPALALSLYASSPHGQSRERQARILIKAGRREEAAHLVQAMTEAPRSTEEAYAARHLQTRLTRTGRQTGTRASDARRLQKSGRVIHVPRQAVSVEEATLSHYRSLGWNGIHAENWLWNATFALLFWDIIYDASTGAFHSPLQTAPSDLYEPGFYQCRKQLIEDRLAQLQKGDQALALAETVFDKKYGLTNPFLYWREDLLPSVLTVITRVPRAGLVAILRRFAQDIRHHARGFPDLFMWTADDYCFVEVKSESDQLSPVQYEWIAFFQKNDVRAYIDNVIRT